MLRDIRRARAVRRSFPIGVLLIAGSYITWICLLVTGRQPTARLLQQRSIKRILLWNSPHRIEAAAFGTGHRAFLDAKCPVSDCLIVANSSNFRNKLVQSDYQLLAKFDAVLFSVHELWMSSLPPPTYRRPPHQRFVLLTQESPESMIAFRPEEYDNFFNWTMSYRSDSDIHLLYGRVRPDPSAAGYIRRRKMKKIAWMVSHCKTPSKREEYVRQLQDYIPVDVYGECGKFKCARNKSHWLSNPKCYDKLARKYKFYLAFENSLCRDYVTEKFFSILQHDLVPIVLGSADYASIAPPHSYIDVTQFKSPADLATYLLELDADDELYYKYFEWKLQFVVEAGVDQMSRHAFCDLCAKLHDSEEPSKSYASLVPQWSVKNQCHNFITWLNYTDL